VNVYTNMGKPGVFSSSNGVVDPQAGCVNDGVGKVAGTVNDANMHW